MCGDDVNRRSMLDSLLLFHLIKIFSLFKGANFFSLSSSAIVSRSIRRASELQCGLYSFLDILRHLAARRVSDKSTRHLRNREAKQIA